MPLLQLPIPWTVRALVQRPLTEAEELLEVLRQDAEPLVAGWASSLRGRIRVPDDLVAELERLEGDGGPVARSLAETVRRAWREFGGQPLPPMRLHPRAQHPLPLA